jgi:hypothetical protein
MDTPNRSPAFRPTVVSRVDHMFPTLTTPQMTRIATHGRRRQIGRG